MQHCLKLLIWKGSSQWNGAFLYTSTGRLLGLCGIKHINLTDRVAEALQEHDYMPFCFLHGQMDHGGQRQLCLSATVTFQRSSSVINAKQL